MRDTAQTGARGGGALASPSEYKRTTPGHNPGRGHRRSTSNAYDPYPVERSTPDGNSTRGSGTSFFQKGAARTASAICAVCLARHKISEIGKCRATTLWSGGPTFCQRDSSGRIVTREGTALCLDWQKVNRCTSTNPKHVHQCSGCGGHNHGAATCSRAQKN